MHWGEHYELSAPDIALALLPLVTRPESWILRRVEEITLSGRGLARRAVSLDLVLPDEVDDLRVDPADADGHIVIPLGVMAKAQLIDFDLQEGSQRLSLVRADLNALVASHLLWHLAVIDGVAPAAADAALPWFRRIAGFDEDDALAAYTQLFENGVGASPLARSVARSEKATAIAGQLKASYMLLVELDAGQGRRRLVRFATDQLLKGGPVQLSDRLGWSAHLTEIDVPGAAQAASYHVEVVVPDGCLVVGVDVVGQQPDAVLEREATYLRARAARYVRSAPTEEPKLQVAVVPERGLFLIPAAFVAVATACFLIAGTVLVALGGAISPTAGALCLAALSTTSGLVLRRDGGRLTVELHGGLRAALALNGMSSAFAGASLAFGAKASTLVAFWTISSVVALLCSLVLLVADFRVRQAETKRY